MTTQTVTGEGNTFTLEKADFISLVKKPANKVSFRIVRSDLGENNKPKGNTMSAPIVRRTRRTEPSPIMQLRFPSTYSAEQVTEAMKGFGLAGYNVVTENGVTLATRADLQTISREEVIEIKITDDVTATVAKPAAVVQNPKSQLTVTSLEFRADKFTQDQVQTWLTEAGVEFEAVNKDTEVEGQGNFLVKRTEVPENEESRTVTLEDGITATIIRSDINGIPDGYVIAVNELAYGNWGWGQLDFASAMADDEFCEQISEGMGRLRDVLSNIVYYSYLTIDARKTLISAALEQFGAFASSLLDVLPKQMMAAIVRSDSQTPKENEMTTPANSGATTATPAAGSPNPNPVAEQAITRAEFDALIKSVSDLTKLVTPAAAAPAVAAAPASAPAPAPAAITRSDVDASVAEAMKPVTEALAKLAGTAVQRGEVTIDPVTASATAQAAAAAATAAAASTKKDVWRGAAGFGNIREGHKA